MSPERMMDMAAAYGLEFCAVCPDDRLTFAEACNEYGTPLCAEHADYQG